MKKIIAIAHSYAVVVCVLLSCSTQQERDVKSSWTHVGPGGGGAMFSPAVSPHRDGFAFVSCDMTGSYVTYDGGESWRMFNLRGPVHFYVFDPLDENVVYASSLGLFKSTDSGKTWSIVFPHPSDIAGVISQGDHADEVLVTKDSVEKTVQALAIDPAYSAVLYAAIRIQNETWFYVSEDGGEHWTKETILDNGACNIFVVPSSPEDNRTLYVAGRNSISIREDGKWRTNPGPEGVQELTQYAGGFDAGKNKFIIYAIAGKSYFNPEGDHSGIFITEDGGATWQNQEQGLTSMHVATDTRPEWRSIATSFNHPNVVYVSYSDLYLHSHTAYMGVARSEDYGKTWVLSWKDSEEAASANMEGGWLNERFGPGWGENPFAMGVAPNNPDVVYGTDFGRTIKTADGGKTWRQVYSQKTGSGWTTRGLEVTTSYNIVFDPFDPEHVFINYTDIGLMESRDGGKSWTSATKNNGVPRNWVNSTYWLVFDPKVKDKIWAGMSGTHDLPRPKMWRRRSTDDFKGGILTSDDGGKTWQIISDDIGQAAITHILLDTASDVSSRWLYACAFGKGVYRSVDGGKTWEKKNAGIEGDKPLAWRIEKRKDGALFLIVARRSEDGSIGNDADGALYKSIDKGESWTKVPLPPGTNAPTSLCFDPDNTNTLLLSAWGRRMNKPFVPDTGGGIYISHDDGKTWKPCLEHDQYIHDITVDLRNRVFYACGFNASAYRSEDRGKTWQRIPGYNFKWGKRVEPDPRDPNKIFVITFGGGVWHGPASGTPGATEDIVSKEVAYR